MYSTLTSGYHIQSAVHMMLAPWKAYAYSKTRSLSCSTLFLIWELFTFSTAVKLNSWKLFTFGHRLLLSKAYNNCILVEYNSPEQNYKNNSTWIQSSTLNRNPSRTQVEKSVPKFKIIKQATSCIIKHSRRWMKESLFVQIQDGKKTVKRRARLKYDTKHNENVPKHLRNLHLITCHGGLEIRGW